MEDGTEEDNVLERNLGLLTRGAHPDRLLSGEPPQLERVESAESATDDAVLADAFTEDLRPATFWAERPVATSASADALRWKVASLSRDGLLKQRWPTEAEMAELSRDNMAAWR